MSGSVWDTPGTPDFRSTQPETDSDSGPASSSPEPDTPSRESPTRFLLESSAARLASYTTQGRASPCCRESPDHAATAVRQPDSAPEWYQQTSPEVPSSEIDPLPTHTAQWEQEQDSYGSDIQDAQPLDDSGELEYPRYNPSGSETF